MKTKTCNKCNTSKPVTEDHWRIVGKKNKHKFRSPCKECINKKEAEYRAIHREKRIKQRKEWGYNNRNYLIIYAKEYNKQYYQDNSEGFKLRAKARHYILKNGLDIDNIREIYSNTPKDFEVDHIIPVKGKEVCGLHASWNLQYLTKNENRFKSNKFDGTYDNESWRQDFEQSKTK